MRHLIFVAMALVAATPATAKTCPIERTIYKQPGNNNVSAGFVKIDPRETPVSDLLFFVERKGERFFFGFASPNGYGGAYIFPRVDPAKAPFDPNSDDVTEWRLPGQIEAESALTEGREPEDYSMEFDAFDAKLRPSDSPPTSKNQPPQYIFSRELGPHFAYAHVGNLYDLKEQVIVEIAMWRPSGCRKE